MFEAPIGRPAVMGVLNVTPDSFSDGGRYLKPDLAIEHGLAMIDEGADIIDVGGESTRPGASPVELDEELRRVLPVVKALLARGIKVSIDTSKPEIAAACLGEGVQMVNDVTALAVCVLVTVKVRDSNKVEQRKDRLVIPCCYQRRNQY